MSVIYAAALVLAQAANPGRCDERVRLTTWLKERFNEVHQITLVQTASLVEIWVNNETQTWTIVVSGTEGISCMQASGSGILIGRSTPEGEEY